MSIESQEELSDIEVEGRAAPIHIATHPPIVHLDQVEVGVHIAYRFHDTFRVGIVRSVGDTIKLHVCTLSSDNQITQTKEDDECNANDVLLHDFNPTKRGKLRVTDLRKIKNVLQT